MTARGDRIQHAAEQWLERAEVERDGNYLVTGDGTPLSVIAFLLDRELRRDATADALRRGIVLFDRDPHDFSKRPCSTCSSVSAALGEPFGCVRMRATGRVARALDRAEQ